MKKFEIWLLRLTVHFTGRMLTDFDRQDDDAAACLSFMCYAISQHGNADPALPIYLFIIRELVDAFETYYMPHIEHLRMFCKGNSSSQYGRHSFKCLDTRRIDTSFWEMQTPLTS
jgi:hypothetical protein